MQVQNSNINISSNYSKVEIKSELKNLKVWDNRKNEDKLADNNEKQTKDIKEIKDTDEEFIKDTKLRMMALTLEKLTGKKINIGIFKENLKEDVSQLQGWGIDYIHEKKSVISQSLDIMAEGKITLGDKSEIDFVIGFSLKQEELNHESFRFQAGDALVDPLVINYNGGIAELSDVKHSFDLNNDGKEDNISFVKEGSGFLALDENLNNKIDDGSELFGPKSGDGFKELSAYDEDQNGWIDEKDSIFSKLLIWTRSDDGSENLYSLKDKGVGAIYLKGIETNFDYGNSMDGYDGKLKATSLFVGDDRRIGTVQEIDLKI